MSNALDGSRYVYVAPNGDSKMITFTHNQPHRPQNHVSAWQTSNISGGFYDTSVKAKTDDLPKDYNSLEAKSSKTEASSSGCRVVPFILAGLVVAAGLAALYLFVLAPKHSQEQYSAVSAPVEENSTITVETIAIARENNLLEDGKTQNPEPSVEPTSSSTNQLRSESSAIQKATMNSSPAVKIVNQLVQASQIIENEASSSNKSSQTLNQTSDSSNSTPKIEEPPSTPELSSKVETSSTTKLNEETKEKLPQTVPEQAVSYAEADSPLVNGTSSSTTKQNITSVQPINPIATIENAKKPEATLQTQNKSVTVGITQPDELVSFIIQSQVKQQIQPNASNTTVVQSITEEQKKVNVTTTTSQTAVEKSTVEAIKTPEETSVVASIIGPNLSSDKQQPLPQASEQPSSKQDAKNESKSEPASPTNNQTHPTDLQNEVFSIEPFSVDPISVEPIAVSPVQSVPVQSAPVE